MIVRGRYVKGGSRQAIGKKLSAHLKYIEHRARGEQEQREDRSLFSVSEDQVSRQDALRDLLAHRHHSVAYHKLILSPAQHELIRDWHEWTRAVMRDLEARQGKELRWYAVIHRNTDNHHVHVVVAGSGRSHTTGKESMVKMTRQDYECLRESGRAHSDYEWLRAQRCLIRQAEREAERSVRQEHRELVRALHTGTRQAGYLIERAGRRAEAEGEGLDRLARRVDDNQLLDSR